MVRIWAVTLLALLPAAAVAAPVAGEKKEKELKVEAKLTDDDPKDKVTRTASKSYPFKMMMGKYYIIDMVSKEVDSFLRLEDSDGKQVALDDDGGGFPDARIVYKCDKDGEFKIICTCYPKPMGELKTTGKYTLTAREASKEEAEKASPKLPPPPEKNEVHEALIGKAAPDIAGDFCINGKTTKLSDLKGKVVLLDFWAVWCKPCVDTFPHLRDWSKDHEKDGFVILGATTYYEKLGFDKENGKVTSLKEAITPADERDMVKEFGAHHKLTHQLLLLTKDNWKKASKDYGVEGIPTAVLIDRRGNVRMIRVGSDPQDAEALHEEIKKLVAER